MNKLLLIPLLFFICVGSSLHSMKPFVAKTVSKDSPVIQPSPIAIEDTLARRPKKELSPITLPQAYYYFFKDEKLPADVLKYIFSLQLNSTLVTLDLKSKMSVDCAMMYIEKLISSYEYVAANTIFEYFFKRANISISKNRADRSCFFFSRDPKVFQILIEMAGNDAHTILTSTDYNGHTALLWHARENNTEIIELILNTANKNSYSLLAQKGSKITQTALHFAAFYYNEQMAKLLLHAAGNKAYDLLMIEEDHRYSTAFDEAMYAKNIPFVQLALEIIGEKKHDLFFGEHNSDPVFPSIVNMKNIELITYVLNYAGENARELIMMSGDFQNNAFEEAIITKNIKIITLIFNAAGENAAAKKIQNLFKTQDASKYTSAEIKEIIKPCLTNKTKFYFEQQKKRNNREYSKPKAKKSKKENCLIS